MAERRSNSARDRHDFVAHRYMSAALPRPPRVARADRARGAGGVRGRTVRVLSLPLPRVSFRLLFLGKGTLAIVIVGH